MDDAVNRLARELTDAIAAAVAEDPRVEACRERARSDGFEMKVSLEAVIGFLSKTKTPNQGGQLVKGSPPRDRPAKRSNTEISANDKRFLRSLRIAADEASGKEVE